MPWNPELQNTVLSIFRPSRTGPGGDIVGVPATIALSIPAYIEERRDGRRQDVPVVSSEDALKIKIWIEGYDNAGDIIEVKRRDLVEWTDMFGNLIDPRWEIETYRPWAGPWTNGAPTVDHGVMEATP